MILKGNAVSKGKVEGKAVVVCDTKDIGKVKEDSVVVVNENSPLFTLAFVKAAAIISERGGALCHLAIVAREMQKPCVLGVENATKLLKEGMVVEVNGFSGEIKIKEDDE